MSARFDARPMRASDLATVAGIEREIYEFPWTLGNFQDSLHAGYDGWAFDHQGRLIAYSILMWLPDEVHLLNVSVVGDCQQQGFGRAIMHWLIDDVRRRGAPAMMLEVRPSNLGARHLYASLGFRQIGIRNRYYPARSGREDALVMLKRLDDE